MIGKLQGGWVPTDFTNIHTRLLSKAPGEAQQAAQDLHEAMRLITASVYTVQQNLNGIQGGGLFITGSKLGLATGLALVSSATVSIDNAAVATNKWVTVQFGSVPGTINIFVWQPTAAGDNTPIAATTQVAVRWIAIGTA